MTDVGFLLRFMMIMSDEMVVSSYSGLLACCSVVLRHTGDPLFGPVGAASLGCRTDAETFDSSVFRYDSDPFGADVSDATNPFASIPYGMPVLDMASAPALALPATSTSVSAPGPKKRKVTATPSTDSVSSNDTDTRPAAHRSVPLRRAGRDRGPAVAEADDTNAVEVEDDEERDVDEDDEPEHGDEDDEVDPEDAEWDLNIEALEGDGSMDAASFSDTDADASARISADAAPSGSNRSGQRGSRRVTPTVSSRGGRTTSAAASISGDDDGDGGVNATRRALRALQSQPSMDLAGTCVCVCVCVVCV